MQQLCLNPMGSLKPPSSAITLSANRHRSFSVSCHVSHTVFVPREEASEASVSLSTPNSTRGVVCGTKSTLAAILLPAAAACAVFTACPASVEAGILSGSTGLESFELPSLPTPEILKKIQEGNVAKYKAFDENFKKSPFLQKLLQKSKDNSEKNKKEIADKYCERGAEWGVGDCSLMGLPQADKDAFFENLRKGKESATE